MNSNLIIGAVTGLMGLGAIAGGYLLLKASLEFDAVAERTTGEVVSLDYRPPMRDGRVVMETEDNRGSYIPTIAFEDSSGEAHVLRSLTQPRAPDFEAGDRVAIAYDPRDPSVMYLAGHATSPWFGFLFFLLVGTPFTIAGALFLWWGITGKSSQSTPPPMPGIEELRGARERLMDEQRPDRDPWSDR
ncbi:MAG: DUF3592 domain-containing protein [Pseudomonadota bacterium]